MWLSLDLVEGFLECDLWNFARFSILKDEEGDNNVLSVEKAESDCERSVAVVEFEVGEERGEAAGDEIGVSHGKLSTGFIPGR